MSGVARADRMGAAARPDRMSAAATGTVQGNRMGAAAAGAARRAAE